MIPVVFLPGFLCDARLWAGEQDRLPHPSRVVDLRFCESLEEMVAEVASVDFARFHLVGFSMGGYVAKAFAAKHGEKLASLTIVAASGAPLSPAEKAAREKMEGLLKHARYKGISERELPRYLHPDALAKPGIGSLIREMSADNSSAMYVNQMRATLDRVSFADALKGAKMPITLVAGAEDRVVPLSEIQALHQALPGSRLEVVEACGHYVPLEKPERLHEILMSVF